MSYDREAIYKYGAQAQCAPANNSLVVARRFTPKSRILRFDRPTFNGPSRMAGNYETNNVEYSPETNRQHVLWKQQKERAEALGHILGGIARNPEHEAWEKQQEYFRTCGGEQSNFQETFPSRATQNSGDIQYKSAEIYDPANNKMNMVEVIEDSACRVNFISPKMARLCSLTPYSTSPIEHATLMGKFISHQWTEVTWSGKIHKNNNSMFYIAPEGAPIDLLVGTEFLRDYPDAFANRPRIEPALLNIQTQLKKDEQSRIQEIEAVALRQSAELEGRRKQVKQKNEQQKQRQKQKETASSSRSPRYRGQ